MKSTASEPGLREVFQVIIRVSFEIYFKDELLCEITMNELFISNKRVTFSIF